MLCSAELGPTDLAWKDNPGSSDGSSVATKVLIGKERGWGGGAQRAGDPPVDVQRWQ